MVVLIIDPRATSNVAQFTIYAFIHYQHLSISFYVRRENKKYLWILT